MFICVMRCAIWYHLYNLKNVKNIHGGILILIKLQALQMVPIRATHRMFDILSINRIINVTLSDYFLGMGS